MASVWMMGISASVLYTSDLDAGLETTSVIPQRPVWGQEVQV